MRLDIDPLPELACDHCDLDAAWPREAFRFCTEALVVIDPEADRILEANPRACALLNYPHRQLLATPVSTIHSHDLPVFRDFARRVQCQGRAWTRDLSCLTGDGRVVPVGVSATRAEVGRRRIIVALIRAQADTGLPSLTGGRPRSASGAPAIVGESAAIREVRDRIERIAGTDCNVLITGESGTGKELVARALHAGGHGRSGPLVKVNCAAVPQELFESEFFGHAKGAFTGAHQARRGRFELADGGTLFLDEVGEIPLPLQGKLLGALQERCFERVGEGHSRRVDVRIVAATNRDLAAEVDAQRFRRDLYYRLNVLPIRLPPLRERLEDLPLLVDHLLARIAARLGREKPRLQTAALAVLRRHTWPGNVRELQNLLERALVETPAGACLRPPMPEPDGGPPAGVEEESLPPVLTEAQRRELDRRNILAALVRTGGKIAGPDGAAELLGLKPTTLRSRMKALDIRRTPKVFH
ncbi:MAG: sigma 54-interacting transcriptional regulator [Candidatus Competibacterales bacterium]|nr:sigma 54-interacting transcriptional regulator [Candidatus Competibacterales bacterium]